ncbi:hypothetical protein PCE31106_03946 [Pandoraea cepalis]|uniref:Uncharacterized protein n=1 Tax=Pandoraea cepalis TaxID=2508294 RepID=A0A5E4XLK7_9BURK|nr:hypothetical protein [Pandoraea cepalis]VVE37321.1 hypothetical protein PCE31106_03946 [Pandoraea cepalis]
MVILQQLSRIVADEIRSALPVYLLPLLIVRRALLRGRGIPAGRTIERWLRCHRK